MQSLFHSRAPLRVLCLLPLLSLKPTPILLPLSNPGWTLGADQDRDF